MKRAMGFRLCAAAIGMGLLVGAPAAAQEQDQTGRIIDRIVEGEQQLLTRMHSMHPVLETYIQEFASSGAASSILRDHYLLGRLTIADRAAVETITASASFQKSGRNQSSQPTGNQARDYAISEGSRSKSAFSWVPAGWAQMVIPDGNSFNRSMYDFAYSRKEFLGEVRCLVFDVSPHDKKAQGRFLGTIWVEDQGFRIVRFNGIYTGSKSSQIFFHFDSWRVNVSSDLWVPAFVYIEEMNASEKPPESDLRVLGLGLGKKSPEARFKAQTRLWGYQNVRNGKLDELSDVRIESTAPVVDNSESQRLWERQAEQNVIQRLERGSLLAPQGEVDQVLNTVVNNLRATNNLDLDVRCRVLLTTRFETFSIGKTIVISRGLLDVLPDEATLAAVLAEELSHLVLGHRTATSYAFGDQVMFNDGDLVRRLHLTLSPQEMDAAAAKAIQLLANSPYSGKLGNAGLFLKALQSRVQSLPNLVLANLGNQFASESNIRQLEELAQKAPPLEENKIDQVAALPLGSRIKLDVWTNQISLVKAEAVTFVSTREKMPFEVTPVALYLTRLPIKNGGASGSPEIPHGER